MVRLTPLQSIRVFGWRDLRPILVWDDVVERGLTLDALVGLGLRPSDLALMQPDPAQWVARAGARLAHARLMMHWPANPFAHLGADLADVLALRFTAAELLRMGVTYRQLVRAGMTGPTERMFRFADEEWALLGRPAVSGAVRRMSG